VEPDKQLRARGFIRFSEFAVPHAIVTDVVDQMVETAIENTATVGRARAELLGTRIGLGQPTYSRVTLAILAILLPGSVPVASRPSDDIVT